MNKHTEREKQEAIMWNDLRECISYDEWSAREYGETSVDLYTTAQNLIEKGYRKQTEWISVDERLPERMKTVLVCIKGYFKNPIMVVSEMLEENGARWSACAGFTVTHWMPLPEPPKGE